MATTEAIWDGMNRLYAKLEDFSKEEKWPELLDMINEQVFAGLDETTPEDKLFNQESFLMRLCCRYEYIKKSDFNIVIMDDRRETFRINNYDFKTFVWAKKLYDMEIDNNTIQIPYDKLTEKQREGFRKKAVNNYGEME